MNDSKQKIEIISKSKSFNFSRWQLKKFWVNDSKLGANANVNLVTVWCETWAYRNKTLHPGSDMIHPPHPIPFFHNFSTPIPSVSASWLVKFTRSLAPEASVEGAVSVEGSVTLHFSTTLHHNTSAQHFSTTLLGPSQHFSTTLLYNTSPQHFSTTLLHKIPSQHFPMTLLRNTPLQHFSTTLLHSTSPQRFPTTLLYNTLLQHFTTTLLHNTPSQHFFTTYNTSPKHLSTSLHFNTSPQHFPTTLHQNTPPQHSFTTLPYNTSPQHFSTTLLDNNSKRAFRARLPPVLTLLRLKMRDFPRVFLLKLFWESSKLQNYDFCGASATFQGSHKMQSRPRLLTLCYVCPDTAIHGKRTCATSQSAAPATKVPKAALQSAAPATRKRRACIDTPKYRACHAKHKTDLPSWEFEAPLFITLLFILPALFIVWRKWFCRIVCGLPNGRKITIRRVSDEDPTTNTTRT